MGKTKSFSCRVSQELYDKFSKSLIGGTTISEMLRSYITNFVNGEDVFSVPDENLKNYNIGFEEGCVKNKIVSTKISDELRNKLLKRIGETFDDIPTKTDDVIRLIMICHITRFLIKMDDCDFEYADSADYCVEKSWFGRLIERMVRFLRERFFSI